MRDNHKKRRMGKVPWMWSHYLQESVVFSYVLRKYTHKRDPEWYFPDISLGPAANINTCWASILLPYHVAVTQIEYFQPEALGSLTIPRLECFSNWTTGLAIRFCFKLVPETYHSFFENFESLMYDFILPILLAKWLHAGTSATSKKLRPRQLTPHFPSQQHYLHLRWATLQQLGKAVALQNKQGPRYVKTCVWMLLPFKIYKTLGKSLSFSEPQVVHL